MNLRTSAIAGRPHRKYGFTLSELLITIAIVSLLALILFPSFGGARENVRCSGCENHWKQIGGNSADYR